MVGTAQNHKARVKIFKKKASKEGTKQSRPLLPDIKREEDAEPAHKKKLSLINIESGPVEDEIDEEIYSNEQDDIQTYNLPHEIEDNWDEEIDEISLDLPE